MPLSPPSAPVSPPSPATGSAPSPATRPRVPPGPRDPLEVADLRDDPLTFLTGLTARYGDVVAHTVDGGPVLVVNRPDLAREVLKTRAERYVKTGTPDDLMLTPLLGKGLLTSDGEAWRRQRELCQPSFRRPAVESFDAMMTAAAGGLADRWEAAAGRGEAVRVDHDLTSLTLTVVVRALLGSDLTGIGGRFGQAVDAVNRFLGHDAGADADSPDQRRARAGFVAARGFLDQVVHTVVGARRAVPDAAAGDLLSAMVAAHGTSADGGPAHEGLSDRELRDQVITMLMAGHETTAKSLTWTLYLLDRHPDVAARLRAELAGVLGGRVPTAADLPRLAYTRQVLEEAMRLYPPVWLISRRAVHDDELGGYAVPAGALVCVSPYTLHRHPSHWDAPEAFDPDRFGPGLAETRPSHLYLPFGGGPRVCIGRVFALVETQLVLATLLQRVRLTLVPGFPVEPEALVTLRPRHGLVMVPAPVPPPTAVDPVAAP